MKRIYRFIFYVCIAVALSAGFTAAQAQSGNLLTNPGFEPPFTPMTGAVPGEVAQGWTPWHLPAEAGMTNSDNVQPEYYRASDTVNGMPLAQIRTGNDAQQYFSFFATHTGGLYQQVSGVTPGTELEFSVYAYVWVSSTGDPEASDDTGAISFQVGIDPNGGTDAEGASVVWSEPAFVYDEYTRHSVTAAAAGSTATVFIRSTASAKIQYNVIYVDDASLAAPGAAATEIPPTQEPTEAPTVEAPTAIDVPPTEEPTDAPTEAPTATEEPTAEPIVTEEPTEAPTVAPTVELPTETSIPVETTPEVTEATTAPTAIPATPTASPTLDTNQFPQMFTYIVQNGDTVGRLATRYGSTIEAIIIANQLDEDARIFVGQQLLIPVAVIPSQTPLPTQTSPASPVPTETATQFVPTLVPTATPTTQAPTQPGATATRPATTVYFVQYGDTLSTIALRFNTTMFELARLNGITNYNLIYVGQRLLIPTGAASPTPIPTAAATLPPTATRVPPTPTPVGSVRTYIVQPGDNLYHISIRFNVTVNQLIQANRILNPNRIFVGQTLIIP